VLQVWEWRQILLVVIDSEWCQCFHCYHPGRNGCPDIFSEKWTKWDILPLLNITSCKIYLYSMVLKLQHIIIVIQITLITINFKC
jgi:hypothetical protein